MHACLNLLHALAADDAGFIVSAELVLVATITVLAMLVGLAEISVAVNEELEDVASAFGRVNQSYRYSGLDGHKGITAGSLFADEQDFCDSAFDIVAFAPRRGGENHTFGGHHRREWND